MADTWREGARSLDPLDVCPGCGVAGRCVFASDFRKFGRHSVRSCLACLVVHLDGKALAPLQVFTAKRGT